MCQKSISILFCPLIFALLFLHLAFISAQEVDDERDFDYIPGRLRGPAHWGDIKKDWKACKYGKKQSPIDMSNKSVSIINNYTEIVKSYKACTAVAKNRGHDITLDWVGDAGTIEINSTKYVLRQLHWHSPSEHTINGRRYAAEMHMVHESQDPNATHKFAVLGRLYRTGSRDPFLAKLTKYIRPIADRKVKSHPEVIDPRETKMNDRKYYRYIGSLTVPPCTEGVLWFIKAKVKTVSREQIKLLREAVHDYAEHNARPLQPINDREIKLIRPTP